jgi:hypothetical protein
LSFYPTSTLKFGEEVEIYFESNNWFAIRPPFGSFSWVGAGHVSLVGGNVGVVLTHGLASRVGSEIVDSCETVQVKLKRGEKILVIDKKETPQNTASPLWFKISPPSGEYRWIPRGAIDPNFPNEESLYANSQSKVKTAEYLTKPSNLQDYRLVLYEESKPETNSTTTPANSPPPLLLPPSETETTPTLTSTSTSTNSPPNNNSTSANTIGLVANDAAKRVVNNSANANTTSTPHTPTGLRFNDNNGSADSPPMVASAVSNISGRYDNRANWNFQRMFDELQSETVAALTGQTDDWVFVTLIEEANRLYNSARTDVEMEKVYHIAESLKRGRAVRQDIVNKRQINRNISNQPATTINNIPATTSSNRIETAANKSATTSNNIEKTNTEKQFDVSGKLGMFQPPLPSLKYPPFAVVDDAGRITCLLTPEAGTDLRPYVGKFVGINGIRGVYRKSGQPDSQHITVKTMVQIEK